MWRIAAVVAAATPALWVAVASARPQGPAPASDRAAAIDRLLNEELGFLPTELDAVHSGTVVSRILTTTDTREVAIAGAMHTSVTADYYVSRIGNAGIPADPSAPDAGRFNRPAAASDLSGWKLPPVDLRSIDACDNRSCPVHLDERTMANLHQSAGLKAVYSAEAWSQGAREAIAGYVASYQSKGSAGLPTFKNGPTTIVPANALSDLRARATFLKDPYPDLIKFVESYPATSSHAAEKFIWSLDVVLNVPVLSATHLTVWRATTTLADAVLVSQQFYTSREVDALMEITLVAADSSPKERGTTVVTINRSIASSLSGIIGAAKRQPARLQAKTALGQYMTMIKTIFEKDSPK